MVTGSQRYRSHPVWETLQLKQDALSQARFDDAKSEQWREDIIEWLSEAEKTKATRQPALYLSALNELSDALNSLPTDGNQFKQYTANRSSSNHNTVGGLENALRALPLPPPKNLHKSYVELLDRELEARTTRLEELESRIRETETALQSRLDELQRVSDEVDGLRKEIEAQTKAIAEVSSTAETTMHNNWNEALADWRKERRAVDVERDATALEHVTALAATRRAAEALAEHAAGDLTAADWVGRATRERRSALWIRFGALAAFLVAGGLGWYIVNEAIRANFDLTVGDGILRASVATVVAAFGVLLLREAGRHFKEADTAEDVALSLQALAPFYAGSAEEVRVAARAKVGDAVLVRNVLSRFAHRDAARHAGDTDLTTLVEEGTRALNLETGSGPKDPDPQG